MAETAASSKADKGTNVQVAVRCRPVNTEEKKTSQPCVVSCDQGDRSVRVSYGPLGKKLQKVFTFDRVFGMYSTQDEVFDQMVRPIVDECLAGFNCTIFAYGQTGTGKTHTMEGDINSEENAGIVPRSVKTILEQLQSSGSEFTIRVSFLELYNEELQDLLNTSGDKKLKLCEDVKKGVVCQNLEEITVLNVQDIFEILRRGIQQRQTAATLCNKNSSRSHSIFTLKIMIKECNVEGEEVVRHGQLNLVDLAGSECIGRSGAKNDRAREAGSINQSLLTLGRVITALVDHHGHVPYRDSKLTRLLQESLGGKAKTCIIATLSPSQLAVEESMSTLDYAYRARNIKNQPTLNQRMTKKVVLKEYCAEIETLRSQLQLTREKNGIYVEPNEYYAMEARLASQESQLAEVEGVLKAKTDEIKFLKADRDEIASELEGKQADYTELEGKFNALTDAYEESQAALKHMEIEFKASEAVVREQTRTEETLQMQGSGLQRELTTRRDEVDTLLIKVEHFADKEQERMRETLQLASHLHETKERLDKHTDAYRMQLDSQSKFLNDGVSDMLERSRGACQSIKTSIDSALATLTDDAGAANEKIMKTCDGLKSHFGNTNEHVESTLQAVQQRLSAWLGDVDISMKNVQGTLSNQQCQLQALSESLRAFDGEYESMNAEWIGSMKADYEAAVVECRALQSTLTAQIAEYKKAQEEKATSASEELASKAKAFQTTMIDMLADMVQHSTFSTKNLLSSTRAFAASAEESTEMKADGLCGALQRSAASQEERGASMASLIEKSINAVEKTTEAIDEERETAKTAIDSVSSSVASERAVLDDTVKALVKDVDSAINDGYAKVDETSSVANTILSEVVTATERMNASSGEALESFTSFLDETGQQVCTSLNSHFEGVGEHLDGNAQAITEIDSSVRDHESRVAETKVKPTGATPRKSTYVALEALAATRNHTAIKNEVRSLGFEDCDEQGSVHSIGSVSLGGSTGPAQHSEPRNSLDSGISANSLQSQGSSALTPALAQPEKSAENALMPPPPAVPTTSPPLHEDSENAPPPNRATKSSGIAKRGTLKVPSVRASKHVDVADDSSTSSNRSNRSRNGSVKL